MRIITILAEIDSPEFQIAWMQVFDCTADAMSASEFNEGFDLVGIICGY